MNSVSVAMGRALPRVWDQGCCASGDNTQAERDLMGEKEPARDDGENVLGSENGSLEKKEEQKRGCYVGSAGEISDCDMTQRKWGK